MTALYAFLRRGAAAGAIGVALLLVLVFSASTGGQWLRFGNLGEVLRVTSVLALVAFGMALVIGAGEIDLSVGSVYGVSSVLYLRIVGDVPVPVALLAALTAGAAIGAVNGWVVSRSAIPSLIVTLGSLFVFRGVTYAIGGVPVRADEVVQQDVVYRVLGRGEVLGLNVAVLWALLVLVVLLYVLVLTPTGNRLLAVGGDALSASSRGVNVRRLRWGVFIASGLLAALAGVLQGGSLGYGDSAFGRQLELQAVAAAVIGGCLLGGGRISLVGTMVGAFILSGIQSFLVVKRIDPQWFILLLGLIIVLASLIVRWLHGLLRSPALLRTVRGR